LVCTPFSIRNRLFWLSHGLIQTRATHNTQMWFAFNLSGSTLYGKTTSKVPAADTNHYDFVHSSDTKPAPLAYLHTTARNWYSKVCVRTNRSTIHASNTFRATTNSEHILCPPPLPPICPRPTPGESPTAVRHQGDFKKLKFVAPQARLRKAALVVPNLPGNLFRPHAPCPLRSGWSGSFGNTNPNPKAKETNEPRGKQCLRPIR
jgi:hypothetical protein